MRLRFPPYALDEFGRLKLTYPNGEDVPDTHRMRARSHIIPKRKA
jgi:hypothetical protein